jgi:lipid-binding SYLF domain-containing protein
VSRRIVAVSSLALASALLVSAAVLFTAGAARADAERTQRVTRSKEVYQELIQSSDNAVPESLLVRSKAVAVFPKVIKGAIGFGARYGKGIVSIRDAEGHWSAPAFFTLTGGSWGFQIGAESAEVVLFFMTDRSVHSLLESKFTLGAKAGLAAGPLGRTAEMDTDLKLDAEMYSYARSKGLFAGVSLEGARLAPDEMSNRSFYGKDITPQAILFEHGVTKVPAAAEDFLGVLPHGGP